MPTRSTRSPDVALWKLRRLRAREERVWRAAEGYVTISDGLAADLTSRFGPRGAIVTARDGVRLRPQRHFVSPRPSSSPLVVYIGHLHPHKGVGILLRAIALLPRVRALVVGGHPAEHGDLQQLKDLAAALGLGERVAFTGFVDHAEIFRLMELADLLAMPYMPTPVTERYLSPLKLFEYMAMGKPIVASTMSSVREVLRDGKNTCLVAPNDPDALAAGITCVLDDERLAARIARTAFDEASSYTWSRRAECLEALLQKIVSRS